MTTRDDERQLIRLLHGELDDVSTERLRARLAAEPALAARHARLGAVWRDLEGPSETSVADPAFKHQVMARVRDRSMASTASWTRSWVATAAATVLTGVMIGLGAGQLVVAPSPPSSLPAPTVMVADLDTIERPLSLTEAYWLALDELDGDELLVEGEP
ncbi:MAG: hypothetical protein AAGD38_16215 [Acidobacteriota bacterium]